jgi:hypothetical protein
MSLRRFFDENLMWDCFNGGQSLAVHFLPSCHRNVDG